MSSQLHAHVDTYTTDCDGPIARDYVMVMSEDELSGQDQPNWFGDIEFHNRVVAHVVNTYSSFRGGHLEVSVDDEYGNVTLLWAEPTEEGGRRMEARFCTDDCDETEEHYRDYRAESMGY